jgi:hypothetical protein
MNSPSLDNHPANPFRPVDYRWQQAAGLIDRGEPLSLVRPLFRR